MSDTLAIIKTLANKNEIQISEHGYDELAEDGILVRDIVLGLSKCELLEDYPDYYKGPCVLVLEHDTNKKPLHAVWGIPKNQLSPAVLVTAYRPDESRWSNDFRRRNNDN